MYIVRNDRSILVPEAERRIAIQNDCNAESILIQCPRHWNTIDLAEMALRINYRRPDRCSGSDVVTVTEATDAQLVLQWKPSLQATRYPGLIRWNICATETDAEGNIITRWHSALCTECYVEDGVACE